MLNIPGQLSEELLPLVVGGQAIRVRLSHCKGCGFGRKSIYPYTKLRYVLRVDSVWKKEAYKACSFDYVLPNDIPNYGTPICEERHALCKGWRECRNPLVYSVQHVLDLTIIRASLQI